MLIPRKCGNVSPQCPVGQERGYRLGWHQGQIAMADEYDGTPCQVIELESEIEKLRNANAEAVAGLMCVASLTQTEKLLWWQKKARETLSLMGVNK